MPFESSERSKFSGGEMKCDKIIKTMFVNEIEDHMTTTMANVIEPFVRRGLFQTAEQAIIEMAQEYIMTQIKHYQKKIHALEKKYGMTFEEFNERLAEKSNQLETHPDIVLNQSVMSEEDDALDWKMAKEMLGSWLSLRTEIPD
jgi:hypothetical protein